MQRRDDGRRGRPSQYRHADAEPGDEIAGGWSRTELLKMNDRFVERVERAIALGLERRPEERRTRAA
jgi:hypothetical protein